MNQNPCDDTTKERFFIFYISLCCAVLDVLTPREGNLLAGNITMISFNWMLILPINSIELLVTLTVKEEHYGAD